MRQFLLFILLLFLLQGCNNRSEQTNTEVLDKEIANRLGLLANLAKYDDSLSLQVKQIHDEVYKLILLSKDIENLGACISKANRYFEETNRRFSLEYSSEFALKPGMHIGQMEMLLKQNELNVYNQLIFRNSAGDIQMFSAQDTESE